MKRVNEIFAETLVEAGIDHVFGMPGGATGTIMDGLVDRPEIRQVLARHEGGASVMADVYGRMTGKPGLLMGQGLWIGTNGGFGIVESFLAGSPMLIVCDLSDWNSLSQFGPYQNSNGEYGALDLPGIMRSITKYTTVAHNATEFIHGVQLAIKHATTGRPGPACVLFTTATSFTKIDPEEANPRFYPLAGYMNTSPPTITADDAKKAAQMLTSAANPVIIAGTGVHRGKAYQELKDLAETLGAPVATSYMGKSAIEETHPLAVGTMGLIGQQVANEVITAADVILAVGTCLAPDNTKMLSPDFINPERQKIIHLDIESLNVGWTFPVTMGLTTDAALGMSAITEAIKEAGAPDTADRIAKLQTQKKEAKFFNEDIINSDNNPILPERVVKELNGLLGPDDMIVLDAGNNRMWMAHHFQTKGAGQLIAAGGAAGVGYGPPAGLAADMLNTKGRTVCVCGDGGMMMHLYVLEMAKLEKSALTIIVLNNSCLGNVMDFQKSDRQVMSNYPRADYASVAKGFGIEGYTIENPEDIQQAIAKALDTDAPVLLDIVVDDSPHLRIRP